MQYRPRLTPEEYNLIQSYRKGKVEFNPDTSPKILIFDLETAPIRGWLWSLWKQNMNIDFIDADWFMISWAAKWLNDDSVMSDIVTSEEIVHENDNRITKSLWKLIDEADVILAHNANKFDVKRMNTRFLFHGLMPPSHYQVIDTLSVVRKKFAISSNRLDYVNRWLGLEGKLETGAKLWAECIRGNKEALNKMLEYNEQDVCILERNYLKIRAWIDGHPNHNLYNDDNVTQCNNCGSTNIKPNGFKYTKVGKYDAYRCNDCGYAGHGRKNVLDREKNKTVVR